MSLDASKVVNVTPRYAKLRVGSNGSAKGQIIGWENIELISDRPLETMLNEFKQLKKEYPERILIGSLMEEYNKDAWRELIERVEETGVVSLYHFLVYQLRNDTTFNFLCLQFKIFFLFCDIHLGCSRNQLLMSSWNAREKNGRCCGTRLCIIGGDLWLDK